VKRAAAVGMHAQLAWPAGVTYVVHVSYGRTCVARPHTWCALRTSRRCSRIASSNATPRSTVNEWKVVAGPAPGRAGKMTCGGLGWKRARRPCLPVRACACLCARARVRVRFQPAPPHLAAPQLHVASRGPQDAAVVLAQPLGVQQREVLTQERKQRKNVKGVYSRPLPGKAVLQAARTSSAEK
jgi:hypothetical protein